MLMPDGEYFDPCDPTAQAIQADITGASTGDDKFADLSPYRTTDQRVVLKDASGIDDSLRGLRGARGIVLGNEVKQPVEIYQRACAESDGRQGRRLAAGNRASLACDFRGDSRDGSGPLWQTLTR